MLKPPRPAARVGVRGAAEVRGERAQPRLVRGDASTTSSSGHTARSGSHGSSSGVDAGRRRDRVADQPARRRELDVRADAVGPPGDAPRRADIRWVSQRSMPRVGTATTSGANGSAQRVGEQRAERLDQPVGPFGSVDVQHRRSSHGREA